jgi:hypothetical protein
MTVVAHRSVVKSAPTKVLSAEVEAAFRKIVEQKGRVAALDAQIERLNHPEAKDLRRPKTRAREPESPKGDHGRIFRCMPILFDPQRNYPGYARPAPRRMQAKMPGLDIQDASRLSRRSPATRRSEMSGFRTPRRLRSADPRRPCCSCRRPRNDCRNVPACDPWALA